MLPTQSRITNLRLKQRWQKPQRSSGKKFLNRVAKRAKKFFTDNWQKFRYETSQYHVKYERPSAYKACFYDQWSQKFLEVLLIAYNLTCLPIITLLSSITCNIFRISCSISNFRYIFSSISHCFQTSFKHPKQIEESLPSRISLYLCCATLIAFLSSCVLFIQFSWSIQILCFR